MWPSRSAAYRIAFVTSGTFAAATVVIGVIVYFAAHASFARQMNARIEDARAALAEEYRAEGRYGLIEAIARRRSRSGDELGYAVFDAAGRHIAGNLQLARPGIGWSNVEFDDPEEGADSARALATDLRGGERLVVAADLEPLERIDETILIVFVIALAAIAAIGVAGALVLGAYLRRRLARITLTADAIIDGAFDRRVPIGGADDEFDRVAGTLNLMLDRIATLVANLRQVSADIAHDLRTPLARMRGHLERAVIDDGDPIARGAALDDAIAQADAVLQIFDAMLRIAEIEEGAARARFEAIDLGALAIEIVEAFQPVAEEDGRRIEAAIEPGCTTIGDRRLIGQAIVNLVENALRHTPPGTSVIVGTADLPRHTRIFVADDGPGVTATDRSRILGRFVRLEDARSTPGHGLGLSMVAAIATLHGITVELEDGAPGLIASFAFPKGSSR